MGRYRGTSGGNGASLLRLVWFNSSGGQISFTSLTVPAATTAFQEVLSSNLQPPAGAVFARISVYPNFGGTTGYHEWQGLFCEEQIGASLLVDGSILAQHLGAKSVTADKISVASLSAISANLGSIVVGNANIGAASVDTLQIQGNAVTVPLTQTVTNVFQGNSNWQEVQWLNLTLDQAGTVLILWSGLHSYNNSNGQNHALMIAINGAQVIQRGGLMANDYPTLLYSAYLPAGTHRVAIWWWGTGAIEMRNRTLTLLAAKR